MQRRRDLACGALDFRDARVLDAAEKASVTCSFSGA